MLRTTTALSVLLLATASLHAQVPADLSAAVGGLPEASVSEKLKKAALKWAVEEADALHAAGMTDASAALIADVRAALTRDLAAPGATPPTLFPPIPDAKANPWVASAMAEVNRVLKADLRFPKGPPGDVTRDATGWRFLNAMQEARDLALALAHPDSPRRNDPALVAPILRRLSTTCEYFKPGHARLADFGISDNLAETYLLLRTSYPELILPSLRTAWERAIAVNADAIVARYNPRWSTNDPDKTYPNADVRLINGLLFASIVLDRKDLRDLADRTLAFQLNALFPDGGWTYINKQNECLTYHGINIVAVARNWQVTGSPVAKQLLEGSRWYYPLSVEPSGVVEYSTSPSWKPYWNQHTGAEVAKIIAGITGCPHNARIAAMGGPGKGNLVTAPFHRSDITPAPAPDNYVTYDANTLGPRGRFGGWSFSGTTRSTQDVKLADGRFNPAAEFRGRHTYIGAMAIYPAGKIPKGQEKWPLSAALDSATVEIRTDPGEPNPFRYDTHAFLSKLDDSHTVVSSDFASLTTTYRIVHSRTGALLPWTVRQVWLMTPQRVVGLVELEALEDTKAISAAGMLKFVSGRASWGVRKEFQGTSDAGATYGDLVTTVHANTFGPVSTEYTDVFAGNAKKSGLLLMTADGAAGEFKAGSKRHYVVEVRPSWSAPAAGVSGRQLPDGLLTLEVRESDRTLTAVFNPTAAPGSYSPALNAPAQMHRIGERARLAFLPPLTDGTENVPPATIAPTAALTIDPRLHVVLEAPSKGP